MFEIKVGMLVSYDYKYLYHSLPPVYQNADKIVLAIDKDRLTWSGLSYTIDQSFFSWLTQFDVQKKITLYEDTFYQPDLTTTECDTRERNMLAQKMGEGGWHIQIDSDEYFLDFKGFISYLRKCEILASTQHLHIYTQFITLFKEVKDGLLVVDGNYERVATATNYPKYDFIRRVDSIKRIYSDFLVVHQSWAREREEITLKLKSWGHTNDFNVASYYNLWEALDENNYIYFHNFHPISKKTWPCLIYIKKKNINEVLSFILENMHPISLKKNNIINSLLKTAIPSKLYRLLKKK